MLSNMMNEHKLVIGTLKLSNMVVSAPMSGITDKAFRIIAEEANCGLVFTEMISANALAYDSERTRSMFELRGEKGPTGVQIFGSDPQRMATAAIAAQEEGAALIDINMGCPAPKVVKNFEGCALMTDLPLAEKIIKSVVKAVNIPVTVKMRKGWDNNSITAVELSKISEGCGASAVTIHGRTRSQFYSGHADWDFIGLVKKNVRIPVIGNGDIREPYDAQKMINDTGCDGIMIGRAAMGNPWLLKRTVAYLESGELLPEPGYIEKISMALRHLQLAVNFKGEFRGVREMRKHIAWYIKGLKDSAKVRELINRASTYSELAVILNDYRAFLDTAYNGE